MINSNSMGQSTLPNSIDSGCIEQFDRGMQDEIVRWLSDESCDTSMWNSPSKITQIHTSRTKSSNKWENSLIPEFSIEILRMCSNATNNCLHIANLITEKTTYAVVVFSIAHFTRTNEKLRTFYCFVWMPNRTAHTASEPLKYVYPMPDFCTNKKTIPYILRVHNKWIRMQNCEILLSGIESLGLVCVRSEWIFV